MKNLILPFILISAANLTAVQINKIINDFTEDVVINPRGFMAPSAPIVIDAGTSRENISIPRRAARIGWKRGDIGEAVILEDVIYDQIVIDRSGHIGVSRARVAPTK